MLSPQRRSFNSGCFVPLKENQRSNRPHSPLGKSDSSHMGYRELPPGARRIGSGRILARDVPWEFSEKQESDNDFGYRRERRDNDRDERYLTFLFLVLICCNFFYNSDLKDVRLGEILMLAKKRISTVDVIMVVIVIGAASPMKVVMKNQNGFLVDLFLKMKPLNYVVLKMVIVRKISKRNIQLHKKRN